MPDETNNETSNTEATAPESTESAAPAAVAEAPRNPNMKWYIIHSYSGFERKVKESLESRVRAFALEHKIGKVLIPTESVTEVRNGKSTTSSACSIPATCWSKWIWTTMSGTW